MEEIVLWRQVWYIKKSESFKTSLSNQIIWFIWSSIVFFFIKRRKYVWGFVHLLFHINYYKRTWFWMNPKWLNEMKIKIYCNWRVKWGRGSKIGSLHMVWESRNSLIICTNFCIELGMIVRILIQFNFTLKHDVFMRWQFLF